MEYIIKPYEGVNEYKFGCLLEDILSKIKNNFKRVDNNDLIKLYLDNLSLVFKDNKLVEISVIENKDVELYYDEYDEGDRTVTVYSPHYWDEIVN